MNVNIALQGEHILFERHEAMLDGSTVALLADIAAPISVEPGKTARVPTPISLQGDGMTIALLEVHAGRNPRPEDTALYGTFMIPPNGSSRDCLRGNRERHRCFADDPSQGFVSASCPSSRSLRAPTPTTLTMSLVHLNDIPVRTVYKAVRPGTRDRAQAL